MPNRALEALGADGGDLMWTQRWVLGLGVDDGLRIAAGKARWSVGAGRAGSVVDEVLGETFSGVLVSVFSAAYDHYPGLKQRCWAHLLRAIRELEQQQPRDTGLRGWAGAMGDRSWRATAACPA